MSDTQFNIPRPYSNKSDTTDSDESINTGGTNDLPIVAAFDDLMRLVKQKIDENDRMKDSFINVTEQSKLMWIQYKVAVGECRRLQDTLENSIQNCSELERSLSTARKMLDEEKKRRKQAQNEWEELRYKIAQFCNVLMNDQRTSLSDDVRDRVAQLNKGRKSREDPNHLDTIQEMNSKVNSTGSILSDLSYSRSEDDLDNSKCYEKFNRWKNFRPSVDGLEEPVIKKKRSSSHAVEVGQTDTVRATTTLTVPKEGPITATSTIESVPKRSIEVAHLEPQPKHSNVIFESWSHQNGTPTIERPNFYLRQHNFQQKTVVMPDSCSVCEKRIRFGKSALRCKDCKSICHIECKNLLQLPCVPLPNTPSQKKFTGTISDYTPTNSPMVPALIVHCIMEIEQRGLNELGLYRIPGSEKHVKGLKERFLTGRGSPSLKDIDIHVLCGCIKDFLRSLTEPLVSYTLWRDFVQAVSAKDKQDVLPGLYQAISDLPQPNRDTLAYIVLHLQKIANSPECKMPIDNLSKVFGPTIVGYSSSDLNYDQLLEETALCVTVMHHLINISSDYWSSFINVSPVKSTGKMQQTPSTDSLLRSTPLFSLTPGSNVKRLKRKKEGRFFCTPPNYK